MERRLFAQRLTGYLQCMRGRRLCRFPLLGKGKLHLHHRAVSASDGSLHQKCFRLIAGLFIRPGCFAVNRVVLLILSARLQNNGLTCRLNCAAQSTTNTRNYHLFFQAPAPEDNLQTLSPRLLLLNRRGSIRDAVLLGGEEAAATSICWQQHSVNYPQ